MNKDIDDLTEEIKNRNFINECQWKVDSYLTKDELIAILNNISFKAIKRADLELITSHIISENQETLQLLTKNISID